MDHLKKLFLDEEELLKLFAHINFKEEMANYFNSRLKNFSETLQFMKGEKILSLGEKNKSLYILLSGELEINLQNEHIAHLYQKGEIIGEMSIITQQNCHADVIAKVDCTLLKIRMDQIKVEAPKEEQKPQAPHPQDNPMPEDEPETEEEIREAIQGLNILAKMGDNDVKIEIKRLKAKLKKK
jgi:hypothetical protein